MWMHCMNVVFVLLMDQTSMRVVYVNNQWGTVCVDSWDTAGTCEPVLNLICSAVGVTVIIINSDDIDVTHIRKTQAGFGIVALHRLSRVNMLLSVCMLQANILI